MLSLTKKECESLQRYFYDSAGFIHPRKYADVHVIIKRIDDYVKRNQEQEIHSEKSKE